MLLSNFFEMQMTCCRISIQALTFETFIRKYKISNLKLYQFLDFRSTQNKIDKMKKQFDCY